MLLLDGNSFFCGSHCSAHTELSSIYQLLPSAFVGVNCASPPVSAGEVYCFRRHQLIFTFDRRVIYHLKGLLRVLSEIDSVCLSVPRSSNELRDFIFSPNLSYYTSMDSSRRALQTIGKFFFLISNLFSNFWPKTEIFSNE